MKKIILSALSLLLFLSSAFSQKTVYQNLIGSWQAVVNDSHQQSGNITIHFIDSTKVDITADGASLPKQTYFIDSLTQLAIINIKMAGGGGIEFIVKYVDETTVKMQVWLTPDLPAKWNNDENGDNTGTLKKVSS